MGLTVRMVSAVREIPAEDLQEAALFVFSAQFLG
jgi:hypothetical protein